MSTDYTVCIPWELNLDYVSEPPVAIIPELHLNQSIAVSRLTVVSNNNQFNGPLSKMTSEPVPVINLLTPYLWQYRIVSLINFLHLLWPVDS